MESPNRYISHGCAGNKLKTLERTMIRYEKLMKEQTKEQMDELPEENKRKSHLGPQQNLGKRRHNSRREDWMW